MFGTRATACCPPSLDALLTSQLKQRLVRWAGGLIAVAGILAFILSPIISATLFSTLWGIEPLTYIGAALLIVGLAALSTSYLAPQLLGRQTAPATDEERTAQRWGQLTQEYFEVFHHDLGRPLRRILGKERELRTLLQTTEANEYPAVKELLDEIEGQAPNFRLMMSNVQVLVQLEAPDAPLQLQPVEPAEVVRRIIDRYNFVAAEQDKQITWWSEPSEFGLVYCDSAAIEHIVTNLVDNTVRFASQHVEVSLTKNLSHFFIRVWDDGPGIAAHYIPHIFDRGWTPEMARREERTSSGLGLFIARSLARRHGGELTVESATLPHPEHHTTFLLTLPRREAAEPLS